MSKSKSMYKKFYKVVEKYYSDLDYLCKRLQDDYNGVKDFNQEEQDRLALCMLLDTFDIVKNNDPDQSLFDFLEEDNEEMEE